MDNSNNDRYSINHFAKKTLEILEHHYKNNALIFHRGLCSVSTVKRLIYKSKNNNDVGKNKSRSLATNVFKGVERSVTKRAPNVRSYLNWQYINQE